MKIVTADITGSLIVNGVDVTNNVISSSVFSGSIAGRVTSLEQFSASLDATFATDASVTASILVLSQSVQASQAALSSSYTATSGSFVITSASFVAVSESYATTSGSIAGRVTLIEGQYATTGSNQFSGSQYISGSIILTNGAVITDSKNSSISFGKQAAEYNQGTQSVAIGNGAGNYDQNNGAVAVGANAGGINQGLRATAIGSLAGGINQGEYALALGNFAGGTDQAPYSIIINATGTALNNTTSSLIIAPIRNVTGSSGVLQYDDTTKEVSYSNIISGPTTFIGNQTIIDGNIYGNESAITLGTGQTSPGGAITIQPDEATIAFAGGVGVEWNFYNNGNTSYPGNLNGVLNLATTGSNNFTGPQNITDTSNAISFTSTASLYTDGGLRVTKDSFVSGTAYFNNVVVYGTSSIQYITSSQVDIGSNIITVNTDTPAVRFGGLSVFDSGSTQLTGSMFWDSERNHWIYSNPSGSEYNSGMIMAGPRNSGALGEEQGTTLNALMKGQGGDHITSSLIYTDDSSSYFYTNVLYITASGNVGIGTLIPGAKFDVNGGGRFQSYEGPATGCGLEVFYTGGTSYVSSQNRDQASYLPLTLRGSCISLLQGNVGINTSSPLARLTVQDDATFCNTLDNGQLRIQGNTSCAKKLFLGVDTSCAAAFGYIQATETGVSVRSLVLQPSGGQVGIGMNTPCTSVGKWLWLGDRTSVVDDLVGTSYLMNNAAFCGVFQYVRNGYASNATLDANGNFNINTAGCAAAGQTAAFTNRLIVTNGGCVGIGNSSPNAQLESYTACTALNNDLLIRTEGGFAGCVSPSLSFGTGGQGSTYIRQSQIKAIGDNSYSAALTFWTQVPGTSNPMCERMRITGAGCVGIGRSCVEFTLDVNGDIALNRQNRLHFATSNVGDRCRSFLAGDYNNNIFVCGPSGNAIAAFMYTGTVCTYNLLNAAGGVKFANGASTLNYYEQGTWTPRVKNGSFTSDAGASNAGWYVRVGNVITVGGTLNWQNGSGAQDGNSLQITCLPFASGGGTNYRSVGQIGAPALNSIGFKNQCAQMTLVNDPGNSFIYIIEMYQNGTYLTYTHSPCVNTVGTVYGFQITYQL